jgi:hypothetical protein
MRRCVVCILLAILAAATPGLAQNILNNPGFETGLMCYYNYVWGGTYQFLQSTDAHSGKYSSKMSCSGTDCDHAALLSDKIVAPPNQSYQMRIYSKCPAGTSAAIFVPNMLNGNFDGVLSCTGDWSPNTFFFQNGASATDMYYYIFLFGASSLEVDDLVLTYGDGTAPAHVVEHPGVRNVNISGQKLIVDGSPFLALGFFGVGYNDLAQAAATGATAINGAGSYNATDCFNYGQPSYLDQVYDLGMTFLPDSSSTARLAASTLPAAAGTFAPHLANIGWFLSDEPELNDSFYYWQYIPPAAFLSDYGAVKSQTSLPEVADFQHASYGAYSDIAPYNGTADIWMAESYGTDFSGVNHAVSLFNSVQTRPIWMAQDDVGTTLQVPKAYWAIIAGATGITYYDWDIFKANPADLAAATQAFTELKGLKNAIFGQPMDALVTAPTGLATMSRFDPGTGKAYILSANSLAQNVTGNFTVQGLAAGQTVNVLYEGRTITAGAGSFTDTFTGVSRHVYEIGTASTSLSASLISELGATGSRDWKFQVYDTGIGPANAAQISGITLTQTGGTACTPAFAPGTFPVALGNIDPSQSATGDVIINFTGCTSTSKFTVKVTVTANGGATSTVMARNNERI